MEKYGLVPAKQNDMAVPFVTAAKGIDKRYKRNAYNHFLRQKKMHPEIDWLWASEFGTWHEEVENPFV